MMKKFCGMKFGFTLLLAFVFLFGSLSITAYANEDSVMSDLSCHTHTIGILQSGSTSRDVVGKRYNGFDGIYEIIRYEILYASLEIETYLKTNIEPFLFRCCDDQNRVWSSASIFHLVRTEPLPRTCVQITTNVTYVCVNCWTSQVSTTHLNGCGSNAQC